MLTLTFAHFFGTGSIILPGTNIRRGLPIAQIKRALQYQKHNLMNIMSHPQTASQRIAALEKELDDQRKAMLQYEKDGKHVEYEQAKQDYDGMLKEIKGLKAN